jgi:ABC-type multidrug transport system ATPase subunit
MVECIDPYGYTKMRTNQLDARFSKRFNEVNIMSEKIIEVRNISKKFGTFQAVKDVSFEVDRGDVFGFLGPNGAGKSTSIRCMLSLITPDSGSIKLFGKELAYNRAEVLRKVGSIIEKPDFYKYLSAARNLEIFARISGKPASSSKIHEMIEFVGLKGREKDKVGGFSHGMKQRLGIAQTLIHDPELIILDEPTTGLDPQGIIDIRNLIISLSKEKNKTILLSSHQLSEIEIIANRMVIINKGRSIIEGNVSELLNAQDLVVRLDVDNKEKTERLLGDSSLVHSYMSDSSGIEVSIVKENIPQLIHHLSTNDIAVFSVESKRKLEDYFIKMIAEA